MFNPNASKPAFSYETVENVLLELTPEPATFAGSIYPVAEVRADQKLLDNFHHTSTYKRGEERSDAKILEKTFMDMVERGDWFSEDELYGDDPDFLALVTFPTSEIDDTFNHIDVIGIISNEVSNHETLPFAIDLTYNTDNDKMSQKFRWKHVYGKKKTAPEEVSEFGESYLEEDRYGKTIRTRALPLKYRYGLKIPGFASAKYFEDKNDPWNPMHEKGRISLMPRFIVGYSPELANVLFSGMPNDDYRRRYGETAYLQQKSAYQIAEMRAKWCTLFECQKQASDIRSMLENLTPEETKWMHQAELALAKKQITSLDTYFTNALEIAKKTAENNPDKLSAMTYAKRDAVCQAIKDQSHDTFINKSWQR